MKWLIKSVGALLAHRAVRLVLIAGTVVLADVGVLSDDAEHAVREALGRSVL